MNKHAERFLTVVLIVLLSMWSTFAEASPQNSQDSIQPLPTQSQSQTNDQSQPPASSGSAAQDAKAPPSTPLPDAPSTQQSQQNQRTDSSQQQNTQTEPTGTAAAKAASPKGAPAARPIGAAIAPAKQRDRRSLLIKVGLLAGACVAVGSVVALSKASSSKPPGAP